MLLFATISNIGKLVNDVPSQDRAIQTFPLKPQSIHLSIKSISGVGNHGPPERQLWTSLIGIQGPPRGPHFSLPLQDCSLPRTSTSTWPCLCPAGTWAQAKPPRPQPSDTPPAATLGSGCLSAHTVHLGNSIFPASLGSDFPPNLPN